ncbi:MAG TPA: 30S ribosomal protein S6 [Acidimicrobiales bacterium]|nr:30S ribosomal protein S6 [Acidimicrobiales bacterium]
MTTSYLPLPRSHRGPERRAPGPEEVRAAMRPYEVMVIFDVDLEEGDIRQRVERVHELVRSKGGTPGSVSHWGRRTFAYEIKHRSEGYYVVLEATAEPAAMAEVDRYLALEDAVLRHKVIRQPDNVAGRGASHGRRRPAAPVTPPVAASPRSASTADGDGREVAAQAAPIAADAAENPGPDPAGSPGDEPSGS